jgi:HEPN domain-containing protein
MASNWEEWFRQAEYDMNTAEDLLASGRSFYAVFMAHLATEKAAKGLYHCKLGRIPPKTHSIVFLLREVSLRPAGEMAAFVVSLDDAQLATRYPDELQSLQKRFDKANASDILRKAKETVLWIKQQL